MSAFYYLTLSVHDFNGEPVYGASIRCANMGYGHRNDPTVATFRNFVNRDRLFDEVDAWARFLPESSMVCVSPEEYLAQMDKTIALKVEQAEDPADA